MKKWLFLLSAAAGLLVLFTLNASAVTLTPEHQTEMLCKYSETVFSAHYNYENKAEFYHYYDVDRDGIDELLIKVWTNGRYQFLVYSWKNGGVSLLGSFPGDNHSWLYAPPGEDRLLYVTQQMGHESVSEICPANGTIEKKLLSERSVPGGEQYTFFYGHLDSFPASTFVFPPHLTELQQRYVKQMEAAAGMFPYATHPLRFHCPDVNDDGAPDLLVACYDVYSSYSGKYEYGPAATYRLYLYDNGSFRDCGTFEGEYARFAYPDYNAGIVLEGSFNGRITHLTVSGGRIRTEMIDGNWGQRYGDKKQIPGLMYVTGIVYPPAAPTGLQATVLNENSVQLRWNATGGDVGVWRYNPATGQYDCIEVTSGTTYTVTGLIPSTYYFCLDSVADRAPETMEDGRIVVNGVHSPLSEAVRVTVGGSGNAFGPGDADGDGRITSGDARLALRASVGLEKDIAEGAAAWRACDADGDGNITSGDARLILRASVGLEDPKTFGRKDGKDR